MHGQQTIHSPGSEVSSIMHFKDGLKHGKCTTFGVREDTYEIYDIKSIRKDKGFVGIYNEGTLVEIILHDTGVYLDTWVEKDIDTFYATNETNEKF